MKIIYYSRSRIILKLILRKLVLREYLMYFIDIHEVLINITQYYGDSKTCAVLYIKNIPDDGSAFCFWDRVFLLQF
jgi:hypothetical protein